MCAPFSEDKPSSTPGPNTPRAQVVRRLEHTVLPDLYDEHTSGHGQTDVARDNITIAELLQVGGGEVVSEGHREADGHVQERWRLCVCAHTNYTDIQLTCTWNIHALLALNDAEYIPRLATGY
jgi:hypothetical protein